MVVSSYHIFLSVLLLFLSLPVTKLSISKEKTCGIFFFSFDRIEINQTCGYIICIERKQGDDEDNFNQYWLLFANKKIVCR